MVLYVNYEVIWSQADLFIDRLICMFLLSTLDLTAPLSKYFTSLLTLSTCGISGKPENITTWGGSI